MADTSDPTPRSHADSFAGIRAVAAAQVDDLRNGTIVVGNANAITNTLGLILRSVKLEIDVGKALGQRPDLGFMMGSGTTPEAGDAEP